MKEKIKKNLIGFILGVITAFSISVIAMAYFPSKDVTYDNKESGLKSTNVQGAIDELYAECTYVPTGGEAILENTDIVTSGDGLYADEYEEGKYTYKGANPNNYVTFNDEKAGWRIILINSDGTIKIMKEAIIGDIAWDKSGGVLGSNDWNRPADLNTYLNGDYYNSLISTAQSQIVDGTYYVGDITYDNNDMQEQINDEKTVISKVKVALPTLSEYIRACSNTGCKTFSTYQSRYSTCRNSDWMYISDEWWTLSPPYGNSNSVFRMGYHGGVNDYSANSNDYAVRPTITLSSEVQITGGDGSQSNPYTLS